MKMSCALQLGERVWPRGKAVSRAADNPVDTGDFVGTGNIGRRRFLPFLRRMARLVRPLFYVALTSFILHVETGLLPSALAASVTPKIEVTFQEGMLTINTQNTTLAQVLRGIATAVGFKTLIYGELSAQTITRQFVERSLPEVMHDLLQDQSWAMLYPSFQDRDTTQRPVKLWVFGTPFENAHSQTFALETVEEPASQQVGPSRSLARFDAGSHPKTTENESEHNVQARALVENQISSKRIQAIFALEYIGDEDAARALETGLGDPDPSVRIHVIEALERLKADRALPAFGQVLYGDTDPKVRLVAVQAIARQRSEAARAFLNVAAKDKNPTVRITAMRALNQWR